MLQLATPVGSPLPTSIAKWVSEGVFRDASPQPLSHLQVLPVEFSDIKSLSLFWVHSEFLIHKTGEPNKSLVLGL